MKFKIMRKMKETMQIIRMRNEIIIIPSDDNKKEQIKK